MVNSDLTNLKFEADKDVVFKDGRKMLTSYAQGKSFRRNDVLKKLLSLSQALVKAGKTNAYLGVSAHYKEVDTWCPALLFNVKDKPVLFNPTDSPTTNEYKTIDGLYFYLIEMPEGSEIKQRYQSKKKKQNIEQSMFTK